jgi:hypothetical protein
MPVSPENYDFQWSGWPSSKRRNSGLAVVVLLGLAAVSISFWLGYVQGVSVGSREAMAALTSSQNKKLERKPQIRFGDPVLNSDAEPEITFGHPVQTADK